MTFATPLPGASAGPAGEAVLRQAIRSLGYMTSPAGVENYLSQYAFGIARELGARFSPQPDMIGYGRVGGTPDGRPFLAGFDAKGVTALHDDPERFLVPRKHVDHAYSYMTENHHWWIFAFVNYFGGIRVGLPAVVEAMPLNDWGSYVVDAWRLPTLAAFLDDPPPYVGGYLARNWPAPYPPAAPAFPPQAALPPAA